MKRQMIKVFAVVLIPAMAALTASACDRKEAAAPALHANGTLEVGDTDLTTSVQRALILNDQLKDFQIAAKARKGDVLLTGTVGTQEQRDLAASVSSGVSGVHTIHNEIVIGN